MVKWRWGRDEANHVTGEATRLRFEKVYIRFELDTSKSVG